MTQYQQTAEGGTDTVNITVGNSGGTSGQQFSLVSLGGSATATYSAVGKAAGNLGYRLQSPGAATTDKIYLRTTFTSAAAVSDRIYFTLNSLPSQAQNVFNLADSAGTQLVAVGLLGGNTMRLVSGPSGATIASYATALTAGTLYRLEYFWSKGTTTTDGTAGVRLFLGDSTSPLWNYTTTTANVGTTNAMYRNIGAGISSNVIDLTVDTMLLDDSQAVFLGPPTAAPTNAVVPDTLIQGVGWSAIGAADIPSALSDTLDTTYAESPDAPQGSVLIVACSGNLAAGNVLMTPRLSKRDGTTTGTVTVTLRDSAGSPVMASKTYTMTQTPTNFPYSLSAAENAALTNRSGLQWHIVANA